LALSRLDRRRGAELLRAAFKAQADDPDDEALQWLLDAGDALSIDGSQEDARRCYEDAREAARKLTAKDPGNTGWQRDVFVSLNKVGDVEVAQGDLVAALKSYGDGLAIRQKLTAKDPGNTGWQRDVSVSLERVGDVEVAQGDLVAALKSSVITSKPATNDHFKTGHHGVTETVFV
jgi:tetratricopeptide (TPR) repeat protein